MKIADPKPGYCSRCYRGTVENMRYVDFEVAFDGAPVLDRETLTIAVLPWNGMQPSHDDLYLCEECVVEARNLLGLDAKPDLYKKQMQEIRRQTLRAETHRDAEVQLRRDNEQLAERVRMLEAERYGPDVNRRSKVKVA